MKTHTAHDMVDNGINVGQNDTLQDNKAVQKPCTTNPLSWNHDVISHP